MAKTLGSLNIGDKVKFGSIYGHKIAWLVADHNHVGYPANSTTFVSEKIIKLMAFDGAEKANSNAERKIKGNNRYLYSNILQWLNKDAASGWYMAQHSADAPPNDGNCEGSNGFKGYEDIPAFLNEWTTDEKTLLLNTTVKVKTSNVDGGVQDNITSKMFLLASKEVGLTIGTDDDVVLPLFQDKESRIAKPTADAVADSIEIKGFDTEKWWYWHLRNTNSLNSSDIYHANYYSYSITAASHGASGLRPACNLSSTQLVSDFPDSDNCYTLIFNEPPSPPTFITVPETIAINMEPEITWGTSVDPEGTAVNYILERKFNNGTFNLIYVGPNTAFTDSAVPGGNTTVQYRVKARDSDNVEGDYITSDTRGIIQSLPPSFTGEDGQLPPGYFTMSKPPAYDFAVSGNSEGEALVISVKLDNVTIRTYSGTAGQADTFLFTDDEWMQVLNGSHTIKITAQNPAGQITTRTLTFTRNVSSIEFIAPINPFYADDMPTEAVIQVIGDIPTGTSLTVLICNNGYDETPAWENCTFAVQNNTKFLFTNTEKTAANWGVKVHVTLNRGSALGKVTIKSVGGNFK